MAGAEADGRATAHASITPACSWLMAWWCMPRCCACTVAALELLHVPPSIGAWLLAVEGGGGGAHACPACNLLTRASTSLAGRHTVPQQSHDEQDTSAGGEGKCERVVVQGGVLAAQVVPRGWGGHQRSLHPHIFIPMPASPQAAAGTQTQHPQGTTGTQECCWHQRKGKCSRTREGALLDAFTHDAALPRPTHTRLTGWQAGQQSLSCHPAPACSTPHPPLLPPVLLVNQPAPPPSLSPLSSGRLLRLIQLGHLLFKLLAELRQVGGGQGWRQSLQEGGEGGAGVTPQGRPSARRPLSSARWDPMPVAAQGTRTHLQCKSLGLLCHGPDVLVNDFAVLLACKGAVGWWAPAMCGCCSLARASRPMRAGSFKHAQGARPTFLCELLARLVAPHGEALERPTAQTRAQRERRWR